VNLYAIEKVKQFEQEALSKKQAAPETERPRRKPVFGPLAAGAGRTLRRVGEGLESWANPPLTECDGHVHDAA
jgi:hypothetical protein